MKRPPLVLVEWEDAYNGNHSWFELDSMPRSPKPVIVQTVGFEVRSNKRRLTLVSSLQTKNRDKQHACDVFVIPAGMVRKRTVLKSD